MILFSKIWILLLTIAFFVTHMPYFAMAGGPVQEALNRPVVLTTDQEPLGLQPHAGAMEEKENTLFSPRTASPDGPVQKAFNDPFVLTTAQMPLEGVQVHDRAVIKTDKKWYWYVLGGLALGVMALAASGGGGSDSGGGSAEGAGNDGSMSGSW